MPSGAKKRKAAKKKKEIQSSTSSTSSTSTTTTTTTNNNNNNPLGENELKSIDEKGSDGGEVDSPRDVDEDHNQFNEGSDEVEELEPLPALVKSSTDKVDGAEGGKERVDVIEWDMKSDESSDIKDVTVVRIESDEGLRNGSGNSGTTSNDVIETGTAKNSKDVPDNEEEAVNSVKESVDSVAESSAGSVNVVNSVPEVLGEDTGNGLLEKSLGSQGVETDLAVKRSDDNVHVLPDEDVKTSSLEEPVTREFDGNVSSSPASQGAETDLAVNRNEDNVHVLPDENVQPSSLEEPAVNRNEDNVHVLPDENVQPSSLEEPAVNRNEDNVHVLPDENVQPSSLEEPPTREFNGNVSSSPVSQSPIAESTNGAERVKDSNTAECSENQPPAASAPLLVQKTSWLSCCGLFEAVSSSNR